MRVAIFDLDNTLSNDEWRLRRIRWDTGDMDVRYAAYHDGCGEDPPSNLDVYRAVRLLCDPIFFTARPECVRDQTVAWITRHLGEKNPLVLMRRVEVAPLSSAHLKLGMLLGFLHAVASIDGVIDLADIIAFDDREDVIAVYKRAGLKAMQLKIHNFSATTPPRKEQTL